jgi:hypothetical protein
LKEGQKTIPPKTNQRYKAEFCSNREVGLNAKKAPLSPRTRYEKSGWDSGEENEPLLL